MITDQKQYENLKKLDMSGQEIAELKEKIASLKNEIKALKNRSSGETWQGSMEDKLSALMDNIPDKIYFKNLKSEFVLVNKYCARSFGSENPADIAGKTDFDFFDEAHARPTREDEQDIIETGRPLLAKEELEVWPDGSENWVSTTKIPWRNSEGKIKGILGISRDISKVKRTETELKCLMEYLPHNVFFKDRDGRFTQISRYLAENHNLASPEDAVGKTAGDFFPKEHAEIIKNDEQKIMETGKPMISKRKYEVDAKGKLRWTSTTKAPLRDHHGNIIGTFGLSRDITSVVDWESTLQISKEKLEKKVQLRTRELRKANSDMKIHIEQLDYLNQKARFFAQLIDKETLLSAIFFSFADLYRDGQLLILESTKTGFKTLFNTPLLKQNSLLEGCLNAATYFDTHKNQDISFVKNWKTNSLLKKAIGKELKNLPCYIVVPLVSHRRLRGVVQIFAPAEKAKSFKNDQNLLRTLASQASISLENAYHYEELSEKTRIESELGIAREIQQFYTPPDPRIPGFNLKGVCKPANEVGGDYLDFFQNINGDWVIVIADVCGKGIPAALVGTSLRSITRVEAQNVSSSKMILFAVNNFLAAELLRDRSFITAMCIVIDKNGKSMNYTRAGHPMLISYGTRTDKPQAISSNGVALGMVGGVDFFSLLEQVQIPIKPGDKFLAYTDGLNEAMNSEKLIYGDERLMEVLHDSRQSSPDETVESILRDVKEFTKGQRQYDDLTMLALERK